MTDQTTSNAQPITSPEGHDAAMAAKFEATQAAAQAPAPAAPAAGTETPPASAERPAWLPEKFASAEDMAKAYAELEGKQSAPKAPAAGEAPADEAAAREQAQAAGIDYDGLASEYQANGSLSAESYAALEKAGVPKAMVDSYIQGQQAVVDAMRETVFASVEGEENYSAMMAWAGKNLSEKQITAFDNAVSTGDLDAIQFAVSGLHARYTAAVGKEPNLVGGESGQGGATDVFRSTAELTQAMKDPRYARDAGYRADIQAKLARSQNVF